jgi:type IV secretory pathway VirB10-like protein
MSASNPMMNNEQGAFERAPELATRVAQPGGVIRRNLKMQVYLGIAVLFIVATAVSSLRHKPATKQQNQVTPMAQTSDANIEEMRKSLELQQRQAAAIRLPNQPEGAMPTPADSAASPASMSYNCVPGQPCPPTTPSSYQQYQQQLSPQQQEQMQLAQQERELAYKARFASNLAYSQSHAISGPSSLVASTQALMNGRGIDSALPVQTNLNLPYALASSGTVAAPAQATSLTESGPSSQEASREREDQAANKRPSEVNINSATGQPYVVYEGTLIETALMNRLDGDASGPVKVLVTNPVYSHDHQHVLIPDGTVVLGETHKIGNAGFGQQRRLAVVFHRMIMPDGYSVDLDQFHGLNQIGETGLKDKVNNHYVQIFGSSIALGIIAGAAEVSNTAGVLTGNGADAYKYGVASSLSQSATTILDGFINIPPTITIREGHRVKVYISQDLLLPAYENHTMASTF